MDGLYLRFGQRLRAARRDAKLTQQSVADRVGLTRTSITNIERGIQHISLHQLYLLAAAVGLHPADLLPDHDESTVELLPERALRVLGEDAEGLEFATRVLSKSYVQDTRRATAKR